MTEYIKKGSMAIIGKTFRLNIEGTQYFLKISDAFLLLAGSHDEIPIFLHNPLVVDQPKTPEQKTEPKTEPKTPENPSS